MAELPDFVTGLVDIARRGRSLGIHLILATQRPAGVVTAEIQANTTLRIALRVTEPAESADVIDVPDAAHISKSTPGRCYVKSGAGAATAVQTARVGGRSPGPGHQCRPTATAGDPGLGGPTWAPGQDAARGDVRVRGASTGVRSARALPARPETAERSAVTDLSLVADALIEAAHLAGVPEQPRPWLEPIPAQVVLALPTTAAVSPPPPATDDPRRPADSTLLDSGSPASGGPEAPMTIVEQYGLGGRSGSWHRTDGAAGQTRWRRPDRATGRDVRPHGPGSRSDEVAPYGRGSRSGEVEPLAFGVTDRPWAQDRRRSRSTWPTAATC